MIICHRILCVPNRKGMIVRIRITLGFTVVNERNILTGVLHDDTHIEFVGRIIVSDTDDTIVNHERIRINRIRITVDGDISQNFYI